MDYQAHYDRLMAKAQARPKPDGYTERHHILPRSMGGTDQGSNLVHLTAREHFVAHELLAKIHNNKMWYALWRMSISKQLHSRQYAWIKSGYSRWMKENGQIKNLHKGPEKLRGRPKSQVQKDRIAAALKGRPHSAERKRRIKAGSKHSKRVKQLEGGKVLRTFPSIAEAARVAGLSETAIRNVVKHRQKTAGGYCWSY